MNDLKLLVYLIGTGLSFDDALDLIAYYHDKKRGSNL